MFYAYAKIIISVSTRNADWEFDYIIPQNLHNEVVIGRRVLVPFGKSNKTYEGFVIGLSNEINFPHSKAKYILSVLDNKPIISQELLELAFWMKDKYYTTLLNCIKCIIPTGLNIKSDFVVQLNELKDVDNLTKSQMKVLNLIKESNNKAVLSEIEDELGKSVINSINLLEKKGYLTKIPVSEMRNLSLVAKYVYLNYDNEKIDEIIEEADNKNSKQNDVIKFLAENDGILLNDLKTYLNISISPINTLHKNNVIKILKKEIIRNTVFYNPNEKSLPPNLTTNQQNVISFILNKKDLKPVLLHGVTGSGKTEIYLNLIQDIVSKGKQAIVLVPEISLTSQIVDLFLKRFGEIISLTHSRLSIGERYDQWKRALNGEISVMIGPRSALFTPFNNLGIIIIDEEHENTYKAETTPKYSAIEVGIKRAQISNAIIVLGSATPSVNSYYLAQSKKYDLLTISERVNRKHPKINIADMRNELEKGNKSIFSEQLLVEIEKNINNQEQTILFLNRRGYSTFISCRKCGYVLECDKCNVNYTYHLHLNKIICHYCGKKSNNPNNCPVCGSKYIKYFGIGTQKVEDEIRRIFPKACICRMDMDTTSTKDSHKNIINKFKEGNGSILIGTQMIAKGLDFPNVTLVGVIAADLSLNTGDYRAAELTYQLLTQVSGRAGRAALEGRVYIQTYTPEHYSIVFAKDNNYKEFYNHEISLRRQMNYPPYTNIFVILFISTDEKKIIKQLFNLLSIMHLHNRKGLFEMLGPAPAGVSKVKNKYRWKLIVKCDDEVKIKNFVLYCLDKLQQSENLSSIFINLTLNPIFLN